MIHTSQGMEQLFKSLVPLKSQRDKSKRFEELLADPVYSKLFVLKLREKYANEKVEGVSIITCTNKPQFIRNILRNYQSQAWKKRELILILNRDDRNINEYRTMAGKYKNVQIFQRSADTSLGHCYNFAVKQAKYDYIATFDDDDYYAPHYLTDLMHAFRYTDADIVGKLSYYLYLKASQTLAIRNNKQEYIYLTDQSFLDGGKKIVRRKVYDQVRNRDVSSYEDVYFCQDSMEKGFKIFSADKYNLVYMRRKNKANHTWKEVDHELLKYCTVIKKTRIYKKSITI